MSAELVGALFHRSEAEMRRADPCLARVKAGAIVLHFDEVLVKSHDYAAGIGMSERIVERLVGDAQDQGISARISRRPRLTLCLEFDVDAVDAGEHLDLLPQHALEAVALELGRT